jgi:hypothetical protein
MLSAAGLATTIGSGKERGQINFSREKATEASLSGSTVSRRRKRRRETY